MYFVHGHSIAYNYNVVSHMLVRDTEERFVLNNVVQLCPMFDRDDNNDEDYMYPLYAEKLPTPVMRAVRMIWYVLKVLPTYLDDNERDYN